MTIQEHSDASARPATDEIRTFLAVMAMALRETVVGFEETAARVSELLTTRIGRADRDLVVTLQNFDRLQQEFATLADVFVQAAAKSRESWLRAAGDAHPAEDTIAKIPIGDLKERLLRHLGATVSDLTASAVSEEAVF